MSTTVSLVLVVVGLAAAIILNTKAGINGGVVAIAAAWIVGCWFNGMTANNLINNWPLSVMFILISTSLFFGVARSNGTLNVLTMKMLYATRKTPQLIPFAVFLVGFTIGALGAGSIAPQLFLSTLIYGMAKQLNINVLILQVAAWGGSTAGGGMFWSAEGANRIAYYGQVEGVTSDQVYTTVVTYSGYLVSALLLLMVVWYVLLGGWKAKGDLVMEKPADFNDVQKKTLAVVIVGVILIMGAAILKLVMPTDLTKTLARIFDIQFVCIAGFVVCVFMGLCEKKGEDIVKGIPMPLILTIGGFCMLIKVAISFGLPEIFAGILLEAGLPSFILPSMFLFFSCIISLFSNFAVIYPLLFPMIPVVAAATGLNSMALFVGTCLGSCCTGFSPFSTGGACELSGCTDTELQKYLIPRMLGIAFANAAILMAIGCTGLFGIFPDPLLM